MNASYEVSTSYSPSGQIEQTVDLVFDGVRETIMRQVMNTKEQQVKDALIALGWTPPKDGQSATAAVE
jgi:hypothetical protein